MGRPVSRKLLVVPLRSSAQFQGSWSISRRADQVGLQSGEITKLYRTQKGLNVSLVDSTADGAQSEGEADVDNLLCSSLNKIEASGVCGSSYSFEHNLDLSDVQSEKPHSTAPPTSKDDLSGCNPCELITNELNDFKR